MQIAKSARRGGISMGIARTRDEMLTFDALRGMGAPGQFEPGSRLGPGCRTVAYTRDGRPVPSRACDSTGAFFVSELERLDMTLHEPLAEVSWGRDIDLREDVTIADEVSSYTISTYGSPGGLGTGNSIGNGKAWIGKATSQVTGVSVDIAKITHALEPWAIELKYTVLELASAAQLGRPIDIQKFRALQLKHQMDIDEAVYLGDTALNQTSAGNFVGLVNADTTRGGPITAVSVAAGASGYTTWANKTADEILADVNNALVTNWANAAWAIMPEKILIPPAQYGQISTQKVSLAGNVSVLTYILENNLLAKEKAVKLKIEPAKWCIGAGVGGTYGTTGTVDRMAVYVQDKERIRYPLTGLQRTPVQYDGLFHKSTYYCRLGVMEIVYPQTLGYYDGI